MKLNLSRRSAVAQRAPIFTAIANAIRFSMVFVLVCGLQLAACSEGVSASQKRVYSICDVILLENLVVCNAAFY